MGTARGAHGSPLELQVGQKISTPHPPHLPQTYGVRGVPSYWDLDQGTSSVRGHSRYTPWLGHTHATNTRGQGTWLGVTPPDMS